MAAPVRGVDGTVIGVVTIAGPLVRLTKARMEALGPLLQSTAHDIGMASRGSKHFRHAN